MREKLNDFPFSPQRFPFFYGWVIVAVGAIGSLCSIPGQTVGVGVFTEHLMRQLGLSRLELSTAYAIGTIASSLLLSHAGRLLDRVGARTMVVISSVGLGVAMLLLSQCDRLMRFPWLATTAFSMAVMTVVFLGVRFFGQGCLTMVSRVMLGKWFNHRRGLATAISGIVVAFAFNGSPQVLNVIVEGLGWRASALLMAAIVGLGMTVLGWLFYRDNPEECGLVMDGVTDPAWHEKMARRVEETTRAFTRREAVGTVTFWAFALGMSFHGMMMTAVSFHAASIGKEMGLEPGTYFDIFLPLTFYSIPVNFIFGWISDRIHLKWLLMLMMVAALMGTFGLSRLGTPMGLALFHAGYGTTGGLFALLVTVAWPRFYGREHLGAISGLNMSLLVFTSALGPVMFSLMQRLTGNYQAVIIGCAALPAIILLLSFKADNPQNNLSRYN